MPKYGVKFADRAFTGENAALSHLVAKWVKRRLAVRPSSSGQQVQLLFEKRLFWAPAMATEDLSFLARCARFPWFIPAPPASIGSSAEPGDKSDAERFAYIFSEFPDEAGLFWTWMRHQRRLKNETKLEKARAAVSFFRIESKAGSLEFNQADIESYLEKHYGGEWSATVEDAIQAELGHVSGKK